MDERTETLIRLTGIKGVGPRKIIALIQYLDDITRVWSLSIKQLCQIPGIDLVSARAIKESNTDDFFKVQQSYLARGPFRIVTILDREYPQLLKRISEPPVVLYLNGEIQERDYDAIAVVGTRSPSQYGKMVTERLTRELVENGITVVSGFARGIDTIAHRTAIKYGGRTIAVLGNGVDRCYPPENSRLRGQIASQGAYISEFPFGTKPDAVNFPRRNRIISGMTLGTLVVEAGDKSGALLTAFDAVDQNRELFAVPGRIDSAHSRGTNRLIKLGAKLVQEIDDILGEIENIRRYHLKSKQVEIDFNLTDEERRLVELITEEPLHIDEISERLQKSPSELLAILLSLELREVVKQLPGKQFVKA